MKRLDTTSLQKNIKICLRMLGIAWRIRPRAIFGFFLGAAMEIGGFIVAIYATARLGALLASFVSMGATEGIWFWLWVDIAAAIFTAFGFFIMEYAKRLLYFSFVQWSTTTFQATLSRIDIAGFYEENTRNQINKVRNGYIWQMPNFANANLDLIYGVLRFLSITVVVSQITWWIVPLIALFLIPTLIAESRQAKMQWFVWDAKGDERQIFWGLDGLITEVKAQMELRSSQASTFVRNKVKKLNLGFYKEQEVKYRKASRASIPAKFLEVAGTAIGSIVVLRQLLSHAISLDRYFFLSAALLRIGGALNAIFGTLGRMQESLLFAESYFSLVDSKPSIVDIPDARKLDASKTPEIIFEHVSFSYPGQDTPVFTDLNLRIKAGEHVAIVGENGAGKTTLIKLLLRFYRPTAGRILIDGHDLQEIAVESLYSQLATLFQDFNHYPLPIDENVEIGRSDEKPSSVIRDEAAKFSGVDEMIAGYQHGWKTVLDSSFKKGIEPSGGQWQRVAIARAFYRRAKVMILDEPTSAIDAMAEYNIFNSIFEHYSDKTTIIVSHRFSTVRRANVIVVVDKGKIIEQGSHRELMKHKGLYHDMFIAQAEGYKE